jgi:MOSC domain-containing protein YiiM
LSHPRLLSVNVARMRLIVLNGETVKTGIYKYPVEDRVQVTDEQVGSDRQADYSVHGGYDKAVYAYANEDYRWWSGELGGRDVEPGLFGENLTTAGIDLSAAEVGSRWRVGTALLEVSEPRIPCSKLAYKMEDPRFVKRFAQANRPGAYLRIIEPGELGSGDPIEVVFEPGNGVTMALFSRAALGDRSLVPKVLEAKALAPETRQWAEGRLG